MAGATSSPRNERDLQSSQAGVAIGLAERGADVALRTASWLSDREPSAVLEEVGSFARRRRPGTFLVMAAAAGVLVGRLTRGMTAGTDDEVSAPRSSVVEPRALTHGDVAAEPTLTSEPPGAGLREPALPARSAGNGYPAAGRTSGYPEAGR